MGASQSLPFSSSLEPEPRPLTPSATSEHRISGIVFPVWPLKLNVTFEEVAYFCDTLGAALRVPTYKTRSTADRHSGHYHSVINTRSLSFMTRGTHLIRYTPRRRTPGCASLSQTLQQFSRATALPREAHAGTHRPHPCRPWCHQSSSQPSQWACEIAVSREL